MPEGDVVLRTARRLTLALAEGELVRSELRWPTLAGTDLTGLHSLGTVSYGKNLLTRFSDGRTLHTHLRMDGTWRVTATPVEGDEGAGRGDPGARRSTGGRPRDRRERGRYGRGPRAYDPAAAGSDVRAVLATAMWTCTGHQLGMMHLLRTHDERRLLDPLGPDVLGDTYDSGVEAAIGEAIHAQGAREIGAVLLDQSVLAGLGTIYMAETLFRHKVSPWRAAADVPEPAALSATARRLMLGSADAPAGPNTRGSIAMVTYGRSGEPCVRCTTPIRDGRVGEPPYDRIAYYCPRCQLR